MRSMTGYGRGAANAEGRSLLLELKSVNHRFLDLNFRMPRSFAALEDALRGEISARVHRGHIDVFVTYRNERQDRCTVVADTGLAKGYLAALEHLAQETGACGEVRLLDLARFADVLRVEEAEEDGSALRALALQCLSQALDGLCAMREAEGARLRADVEGRLDNVSALVDRVALRAPKVAQDYRERLQKAVEDALSGGEIDLARLTQEVALYSDRINIDEEIARMRSHVGAMRDALKSADPVGRQMDFIVQEMNREANTMGSKASDIELTSCVVNLKSEIEKIREQVQNIE